MHLYKCECGLLTSEEFQACPSCGNKDDKVLESVYDLNEEVFTITMDDIESVLDNDISDDLADKIKNTPRESIMQLMRDEIEIPWSEYVESVLESNFCD